jgi:hypothetical protein
MDDLSLRHKVWTFNRFCFCCKLLIYINNYKNKNIGDKLNSFGLLWA